MSSSQGLWKRDSHPHLVGEDTEASQMAKTHKASKLPSCSLNPFVHTSEKSLLSLSWVLNSGDTAANRSDNALPSWRPQSMG